MAEFFLKFVDATDPSPARDQASSFKAGDLVEMFESGRVGPMNNPAFAVIRVPTITLAQVTQRLGDAVYAFDPFTGRQRTVTRARYFLDRTLLTNAQRNTFLASRDVTLTLTQFRSVVRDKVTGLRLNGNP